MLNRMFIFTFLFLLLSLPTMATPSRIVRAIALDSETLSLLQKGKVQNLTVEFRESDRLPINFKAMGDLFESVDETPIYVEVKKTFFIRVKSNNITMSFDGEMFKPIKEMLAGSLTAGASSDSGDIPDFPASAINIVFKAYIK